MQKPNLKAPHAFFVITVVVMIICSILNITSLAFGIPALMMAIMVSMNLYVLPSVCVCDLYDVYNFIMYTLIGLEHSFLR